MLTLDSLSIAWNERTAADETTAILEIEAICKVRFDTSFFARAHMDRMDSDKLVDGLAEHMHDRSIDLPVLPCAWHLANTDRDMRATG